MSDSTVTLDVRDDFREGREPFGRIMEVVARLRDDERLLLIAPCEPAPLLRVMEGKGFCHRTIATAAGDWEVMFSRSSAPGIKAETTPASSQPTDRGATEVEVDARGLEPPQPLVAILEALAELPPGATLRAHTDRRPMHLYAQLEARGFVGETEEQGDGSYLTHIRRA